MNTRFATATLVAAATVIAGCAGMETNPALEQARSDVARAESDAVVVETAETRLQRARDHLETASALWQDEGDSAAARVEHESLLASRNAEIALTQADIARNERAIEEAETTRAELLAQAREREAERAEREAARAEQRAAARGLQAERAENRADQLAEELAAERTNRGLVLTLDDVLFETDSAALEPGASDTIARVAEFLREYPDRGASIEGHTDSRGSDEYNRRLSERRAQSVLDALVAEGVDAARLSVRGMGEQVPVATNDTAAGRQQNRRVEIVISDEDGDLPAGA